MKIIVIELHFFTVKITPDNYFRINKSKCLHNGLRIIANKITV